MSPTGTRHGRKQAQRAFVSGPVLMKMGGVICNANNRPDALQLAKEHQAYNVAGYICAYMANLYGLKL